jgi:hypothetical protein
MFIPLALGTLIALLIAPRRQFWHLLMAAFVSSAVARAAPDYYWLFVPAWVLAVTLRVATSERPAVVEMFTLTLAGVLVWASDNTVISQALMTLATALALVMLKVFEALGEALGIASTFGAAVGPALAWTYLSRRLERAEDAPFAIIAVVVMGWVMIAAVVRAVGEAAAWYSDVTQIAFAGMAMAVAFVSIYRLYEALKGEAEAAVDAAIGVPFLAAAFPELWQALVPIVAAIVILDTALSGWQRRLGVTSVALAVALAFTQ